MPSILRGFIRVRALLVLPVRFGCPLSLCMCVLLLARFIGVVHAQQHRTCMRFPPPTIFDSHPCVVHSFFNCLQRPQRPAPNRWLRPYSGERTRVLPLLFTLLRRVQPRPPWCPTAPGVLLQPGVPRRLSPHVCIRHAVVHDQGPRRSTGRGVGPHPSGDGAGHWWT